MPIIAIFESDAIQKEVYEALRRAVDWEKNPPAGVISHVASFDEGGKLVVVDVWESQEQLETFLRDRLAPELQKRGLPIPAARILSTHVVTAYPGVTPHIVQ